MKNLILLTLTLFTYLIGYGQSRTFKEVFLYLPMDGNTLDSTSHNYDATRTGATFVNDRFGKPNRALSFDGVDDKLVISNLATVLPTDKYTISFWLKTAIGDKKSANTFMVMPDDVDNRYSASIYYSHSGVSSHFADFGPISNRLFFQPDLPDGKWNYFEIVMAEDSLLLYKNNKVVSFITGADHFVNRTGALSIGMGKDGFIKGIIDDFKITIHGKPQSNYYDAFLYLPMDGNSFDSTINNYDATRTGATYVKDRFGDPNGALSFDGIDDKLVIPGLANKLPVNNYTISFWLKTEVGDQKSANTFMVMPDNTSNRYSASIFYSHSGTSSHFVDFGPISNRLFFQPDWPNGKWNYFEMVMLTDSLLLFKNDTLISFLLNPDHFTNRTGDLNIGTGKDGYIKGVMDDFKIVENNGTSGIKSRQGKIELTRINFYPNPGNTGIYRFESAIPVKVLNITNSLGQNINFELSDNELKIDAPAGVFFVKGTTNGSVFIQKLVLNN